VTIDLTIKNYRCFPESSPARISFKPGFTALLGPNNSGKSALLRFFYEFRSLFLSLSNISTLGSLIVGGRLGFSRPAPGQDPTSIFSKTNEHDINIDVELDAPKRIKISLTLSRSFACIGRLEIAGLPPLTPKSLGWSGTTLQYEGREIGNIQQIAGGFMTLANTVYVPAFRNAINAGANSTYFDMAVGQAFVQTWRAWMTGLTTMQNETIYRVTDDIEKIFGLQDLQINPSDDNSTFQVFVEGKSYRLEELGSGFAQFVLVLGNVAIRRADYVLIDEPEINLHPSLQLDFLTTIASYAARGIFYATHSVGLARSTADSIYALRLLKRETSSITLLDQLSTNLPEFLGELSYSGYQILGFKTILLVEGPTDVKTIQQFLRWVKKDHEIVLLPLGGSHLINDKAASHLTEVKRISESVIAIIDSEKDSSDAPLSKDRAGFLEACQQTGVKCHVLERRAIENYLTDKAVKRIKGEKYRALGQFEKLADVALSWSKSENWRIAREMSLTDLEGTDLEKFISDLP
jgi:ABC-type branched-subunit amino acid transport system ATPase component